MHTYHKTTIKCGSEYRVITQVTCGYYLGTAVGYVRKSQYLLHALSLVGNM